MSVMLKVCENYAKNHNIIFSTDENPTKSKTKVVYMCGNEKLRNYPAIDQHDKVRVRQVRAAAEVRGRGMVDCSSQRQL